MKRSQWPQNWHCASFMPSGLVYAFGEFAAGSGKGFQPSFSAAAEKMSPASVAGSGPCGYSLFLGASNGLPPGWIFPFRLPALPAMPKSFSNCS